jgi:hypothetical protein
LGGERSLEGRDELLTIAEIAVGLAGFSGVVAAFLQPGGLHIADRLRFLAVFTTAFVALVLSFVPILLAHSGVEGSDLWRYSSLTMLVVSSLGFIPYGFGVRRIRAELGSAGRSPLFFVIAPAAANLVLQIANSGAWFWRSNPAAYLIGMLCWLYIAGVFFVFTVLFRPSG